jgi:hypothetical protein
MATAQAIISKSMRILGVIASGESPTSVELNDGLDSLNSVIDSWTITMPLNYCEQDESITMTASQAVYAIGDDSMAISSITRTLLVATVTTAQPHGLETGCKVTVSGAGQADYNKTAAITVTGPKTFTYAVANDPVTPATGTLVFTSGDFKVPRPTKLTGAFSRADGVDTPIGIVTEGYWTNLIDKTTTAAAPTKVLYRASSPFGLLFVNPPPTGTPEFHVKYMRTIQEYASLSTDQVLPPGYRRMLELALALELAPEFQAKIAEEVVGNLQQNLQSLMQLNSARLTGSVITKPQMPQQQ